MKRQLTTVVVAAVLLAGCGGGGGSGGPTPPRPTSTPSGVKANVTVTIPWPTVIKSGSLKRGPLYLSNSTLSVVVYLNGAPIATIDNPCVTGPVTVVPGGVRRVTAGSVRTQSTCTSTSATFSTNIGYNTFGATGYDLNGGAGKALATAVTPVGYTVTAAGPNLVTVTMNGIVASAQVDTTGIVDTGLSHPVNVPVYGLDADNNIITGAANYANALTVSLVNDTFGQFTGFSSATFAAPGNYPSAGAGGNVVNMTFSGVNDCTAQFNVTAPAVPTLGPAANFTQTLDANAATTITSHFARNRLCWAPIGATTTYYLYRGLSAGGESGTALASFGPSTQSYNDYTARSGTTYYYKVCNGPLGSSTCDPEVSNSPSSDPNVYLGSAPTYWFDINDQPTVTAAQVQDKSGGGNTMFITGMANTANAFNGRNALLSTVPNVYARVPSGAINPPGPGLTAFVVASQNGPAYAGAGGFQRLLSFGYSGDNFGFVGTASNGLVASFFGNGAGLWYSTAFTGPATTWTARPSLYVVQSDGSSTAFYGGTGIGSFSWFNGTAMNNVGQGSMPATTGMNVGTTWVGSPLLTQGWNGYIAEIIVYPLAQGTIGNNQRRKFEGYLACKWGFQGSLPAGHPYAAGNPCP